ncbi:hypothetical protein LTR08_001111 [Meristemomyces frigidus]|nr:hypothetical protein LTR08_001111 [Meristemomyces frigidus]
MVKRRRDEQNSGGERSLKRARPDSVDRFTSLSDELILRVLSYLPVSHLVVCQRLSHKYQSLAGDSQLWKEQYYNRFVRPRASRLPGLKERGDPDERLSFASKASRWLEDEHLVDQKVKTNWKKQYKLRHNWSRGSCAVNEIQVAEQATVPPVLVQMHDGVIYMANQADGLRAWPAKGERKLIAQIALRTTVPSRPPTSLAVDPAAREYGAAKVVVGFEDGAFSVFVLKHIESRFVQRYSHEPSSNGVVSAVALSWPFVVTMTATHLLSLYWFNEPRGDSQDVLESPLLLHSLKSHTVWPPLSISLRKSAASVSISMAYTLPTYLSGWVRILIIRILAIVRPHANF